MMVCLQVLRQVLPLPFLRVGHLLAVEHGGGGGGGSPGAAPESPTGSEAAGRPAAWQQPLDERCALVALCFRPCITMPDASDRRVYCVTSRFLWCVHRWHRAWFVLDADSFRTAADPQRQAAGGPAVTRFCAADIPVFPAAEQQGLRPRCFNITADRWLNADCCHTMQARRRRQSTAYRWAMCSAPRRRRTPACRRALPCGCSCPATRRCVCHHSRSSCCWDQPASSDS